MRRVFPLLLALTCALFLDSPAPRRSAPPPPPLPLGPATAQCDGVAADLTAVTWNTGLGPGMVSYSTPRAPHVAAAIAETEFDVLCLQEVWTADDQASVLASLGLPPRNTLVFDTTDLQQDAAAR
ncbi:MAG TPA: endonuclease/exonuclease/phosphatase family protein, partial [Candidatus Eisenbacteria bacterium]|nr:endonuclease/exonuclease/phosphatase family protein [Candidatus Eisenbacteria bacterium]